MSTPVPPVPVTAQAAKAADALATIVEVAQSAAPPEIPSTSGSWAGWSWKKWWTKNKAEVKTILSLATGLGTAWISVHLAGDFAVLVGGVFGLGMKFLLDFLDYGLSDSPK